MKRNSITIVLVPKTREPLTLELTIRELALAFLLLAAVLFSAGYSVYRFRDLNTEYSQLTSNLYSLKAELKEKEHLLRSLKSDLESKKGLILLVDGSQDTTVLRDNVVSPEIRVDDLRVENIDRSLSLDFRLTNTTDNERLMSGYLMLIAEHGSGEFDLYGTFPDFALSSARPVIYSQGESYSIRRYKQVEARLTLKDDPENYKSVKFLAFNENGQLLLHDSRALRW